MAKSIMIQGTMSNVGKSLICTALCRILKQDGYKVAPFKSQNMALNSYITKDGLEMGKAQAVQAEACGIEPSVNMNPVLLKPTGNRNTQVVMNGKVLGNMMSYDYFEYKKEIIPNIVKAYNTLDEEYDVIIIEGAGSPVEINLKSNDIVNMRIAKMFKSPVVLVGDIDRGGVFAQLYGTIALLDEDERNLIKGLIVNKFKGDVNTFLPGLDMFSQRIEQMSKAPFMGVIPFLETDIDEEDGLSQRLTSDKVIKEIDIAVINFPKISNFNDLNPFERLENVSLRYISSVSEIGNPQMIILPGSKNSISDLKWLRHIGLEDEIIKREKEGVIIFGICGGYQMLGDSIFDPYNIEEGESIQGINFLPVKTIFEKEKIQKQSKGIIKDVKGCFSDLNGLEFHGYEIHMGRSSSELPVISSGNIYGTYIHGFFDEISILSTIIASICKKNSINIPNIPVCNINEYKEKQYEKLALEVRNSLDIDMLYKIIKDTL